MSMITYGKLARKRSGFKSITGVTIHEFDGLYRKVKPAYKEAEMRRLSRPNRQRAPGAGVKFKLSWRDRLLMTLMHLRLYATIETLGFLFGVRESTVSRNVRSPLCVLQGLGQATLGWPTEEKRPKASLEEILADYPDLVAIVDATRQPVQIPEDKDNQMKHYSGKKKSHTGRTQIVVNEQGRIRRASASVPGSIDDLSLLRSTRCISTPGS